MKANELRIGNHTQNGIVVELSNEDIVVFDGTAKWRQSAGLEIEPLPLTEEWMKRFKLKEVGMVAWSFRRYHIDIKGGAIGIYRLFFNDSNSPMIEFQYVHELQNLYFTLTGEELAINKP